MSFRCEYVERREEKGADQRGSEERQSSVGEYRGRVSRERERESIEVVILKFNSELNYLIEHGSEEWNEFLDVLGTRIQLKGWAQYNAGLDVKSNTTGTHSLYTNWK